jgi:hypothetical protein
MDASCVLRDARCVTILKDTTTQDHLESHSIGKSSLMNLLVMNVRMKFHGQVSVWSDFVDPPERLRLRCRLFVVPDRQQEPRTDSWRIATAASFELLCP